MAYALNTDSKTEKNLIISRTEFQLKKIDGSCNSVLNNDDTKEINIVGNWIYYVNGSDNNKIYKIKDDLTSKIKITDDSASNINISDDYIYYRNNSDSSKIYKVKVDGTEKVKLSDNNGKVVGLNEINRDCEYVKVYADKYTVKKKDSLYSIARKY